MDSRRVVEWLVRRVDKALDFLGIGEVSLELTGWERRAFIVVAVLPAFVLTAWLYQLGFEIDNGSDVIALRTGDETWVRLYYAADTALSAVPFLAAAFLFFHGVGPVRRGLGTWSFLAAVWLVALALLAAAYAGFVYLIVDSGETRPDLQPDLAVRLAEAASLIAAGYGFLAYRGLRTGPEAAV